MDKDRLTITELADYLGVHYNTIRLWEKQFNIIVPRAKDTQRSRYYTEKEISIFTMIRNLRIKNMGAENIRIYLSNSSDRIEQEESALEALPISEVSAAEIKDLISNIIIIRERQLIDDFKKEIQEELSKQEDRIIDQVSQRLLFELQSENIKLVNDITKVRFTDRKKGILNRLFNR